MPDPVVWRLLKVGIPDAARRHFGRRVRVIAG